MCKLRSEYTVTGNHVCDSCMTKHLINKLNLLARHKTLTCSATALWNNETM